MITRVKCPYQIDEKEKYVNCTSVSFEKLLRNMEAVKREILDIEGEKTCISNFAKYLEAHAINVFNPEWILDNRQELLKDVYGMEQLSISSEDSEKSKIAKLKVSALLIEI